MLHTIFTGLMTIAGVAGQAFADAPPTEVEIERAIEKLGSTDYTVREAASSQLAKLPPAIPALRRAANTSDQPEVRKRAAEALKALAASASRERFKKQTEYAKNRQVDRLIESMVAWREAVGDQERLLLRQFSKDIFDATQKVFGPKIPEIKIAGLIDPDSRPPTNIPLAIGEVVRRPNFPRCDAIAEFFPELMGGGGVYVSRDGGNTTNGHGGPVSLMNGSFRTEPQSLGAASNALVICNGDYTANDKVILEDHIIICTGTIILNRSVERSLIIAGGEIKVDPGFVKLGTKLHPKEKRLNDILKFYDAAAEGLHVEVADKKVVVTKVDAGKAFAAGGLLPGDRILRVNDQPVADLRNLNRYLCRAEVGHLGVAAIAVVRGEKVVDLTVKLAK